MDIIFLGGLQIETIIGIYDWERETKQTVILDIEMAWDIQKAAETDDIQHTLDYKAVSKRIIAFVEASNYFLVETDVGIERQHILLYTLLQRETSGKANVFVLWQNRGSG